jgi:hypothetical protein
MPAQPPPVSPQREPPIKTDIQVGLSATCYLAGAVLTLLAAACEAILGVKAERRSLEEIAAPLSSGNPQASLSR